MERASLLIIRRIRLRPTLEAVAIVALGFWAGIAVAAATPRDQAPSAAGLWEKLDDSGAPEAWFRITDCGSVYEGKIVKIFPKPGEDPSQFRCEKCEGAQRNAPVVGITFIKGMRRNGLTYEGGTILDPRDGSVYQAQMELSPDGKRLTVRGYLGIPLLGQSQVWRRLPDNAPGGAPQTSNADRCSTTQSPRRK